MINIDKIMFNFRVSLDNSDIFCWYEYEMNSIWFRCLLLIFILGVCKWLY